MSRIQKSLALTLAGGLTLALVACATIMQGSRQEVSFGSTPSSAALTIDGNQVGSTPYAAKLKRKDKHIVRIELAGYQPYELAMSRGTSGWVWGNIVFGGLPGLIVDAITGAMYKLKPEEVQAALAQQGARVDRQSDMLVVMVTMRPDPRWEPIGSMMPQ
jgi:hypothetical protein